MSWRDGTDNDKYSPIQTIHIFVDGVLCGTGQLSCGIIGGCGLQFCDDADESEDIYAMIEDEIERRRSSLVVQ